MNDENIIIRHIRDLPTWYNIEKYARLEQLNSSDWYDLLLQRQGHINFLKLNIVEFYKDKNHPIASALNKLRNDPLYFSNDDLEAFLFGGGQLSALKNDRDFFNEAAFGIKPMTLMRMYQIECWYEKEIKIKTRNWVDKIFNHGFDLDESFLHGDETKFIKSYIHEPISNSLRSYGKREHGKGSEDVSKRSSSFVEIDFSLPDKTLIEQFKQHLNDYREKFPDCPDDEKFKYPNFSKWIDFGVLPFLDLQIWQLQTSNKIPNRVLADAIYPKGEKGEEIVRKTTKKIAKTIMSFEYLNFFSTIVAQENRK